MDLTRRIQLYLIGLIIGGGIAYFIYGDRITNGAWTPESKLKQRLHSTLLQARPSAEQQLAERNIRLEELRLAMDVASIDFSDSERTSDSMFYAVDTRVQGKDLRLIVVGLRDFDRDSTATLWSVQDR